jgi:hypothetical protein
VCAAGVPQGDDIAAGAPQGGDITVRNGGGVAPVLWANVATVLKGDAIRAATIGSGRLRESCEEEKL